LGALGMRLSRRGIAGAGCLRVATDGLKLLLSLGAVLGEACKSFFFVSMGKAIRIAWNTPVLGSWEYSVWKA